MKNIFIIPLLVTQLLLAIVVPTIVSGATKSVTIDWTMSDTTDVTGYKMYYSYSIDMSSKMLACETSNPTVTSLTCSNVDIVRIPVYFIIAAITAEGEMASESEAYVSPISVVQNFLLLPTSSISQPTNIAPLSTVTVSSENLNTSQTGTKAIDSVVDGYPGDYLREWATMQELAGAWINLSWGEERQVNTIKLFDRPNTADNILQGVLTFSDGTSVNVGALPIDGKEPAVVTFDTKKIIWLKFLITKAEGGNIGLSELEVYGR